MDPKLLIVSHYFPPSTNTSGRRPARLAEFVLRRSGEVAVVSSSENSMEDTSVSELTRYLVKSPGKQDVAAGIFRGFALVLLCLRYLRVVIRAVRDKRPDYVLWRGVPFWYFPLAPVVKLLTRVPYVLDFGDMWYMKGVDYRHGRRTGMRQWVDKLTEAWSVHGAALVILTTDAQRDLYRKRYHSRAEDIVTVRWGYDAWILRSLKPVSKPAELVRVVIFGRFARYSEREALELAEAVASFTARGREVEVVQLGDPEQELRNAFSQAGVEDALHQDGMVSYETGMDVLASADCAVLNPLSPVSIPVKTYDYIGCRKPILCFAPAESELTRLLTEYPAVHMVRNVSDAVAGLERVAKGELATAAADFAVEQYSMQHQFERLMSLLRDRA
ncbi:MAG: glycosyltransferase [Candidatus Pacebacteria bacterium]|nr:glycosyltransferase [Candidatus Paceibacterota bacterium]